MNLLAAFLNRIASPRNLLILIVLYVLFPAYFLKHAEEDINQLSGKIIGPIDLTIGFDPERTLQMVADYSDTARSQYATTELTIDVVYPLVYALLFGVILTLLFRKKPYAPLSWLNALPFVMQGFDYLENGCIVVLLKTFPDTSYNIAVACETFKLLKWLVMLAVVGLILYGLVRLVIHKIREA
ncbi:MAG: hypothetical protein U0Y10_05800 [Spirosomataceae bacterium]